VQKVDEKMSNTLEVKPKLASLEVAEQAMQIGHMSSNLRHITLACDLYDYVTGSMSMPERRINATLKELGLSEPKNGMTFTFPWPTKMLHPNTPGHWAAKAKAKKAYRTACRRIVEQTEGSMPPMGPDDALRVTLTFYPPNKRDRDWDNLLASMKSGLDGLADGLGVNDSLFRPAIHVADQIGGFVRINVEVE